MQDIKIREDKIKAKRKQTLRRDFVKEIGSRMPVNIYKQELGLCRYPNTDRHGMLMGVKEYHTQGWNYMHDSKFDSTQSFFAQLSALYLEHPKPTMNTVGKNDNSDYADSIFSVRGAYLSFATGDDAENILYSFAAYAFVNNVLNSVFVTSHCDNVFFSVDVTQSFNIFYSKFIINSSNLRFCSNMTGCTECLFCEGLMNASYAIHNEILSKEEYFAEKKKLLAQKDQFTTWYKNVKTNGENAGSKNITGQRIIFSEDVENGVLCSYMKNSRNVFLTAGINLCTNFYDCIEAGFDSHDYYAVIQSGTHGSNVYCSNFINQSTNIYYSLNLDACSYCIGCIGLKNKSFCIFNKEYNKEEWFELANQIFAQMDAEGTLGAYFSVQMNPYYFNDTVAYLIDDSFTKDEVTKEGYLRRDTEIKVDVPEGAEVIAVKDLSHYQGFDSDGNWKIDAEIMKKVIKDDQGNYYKVVPMELDFLQKYGLPLPDMHRLERIKLGFKFK